MPIQNHAEQILLDTSSARQLNLMFHKVSFIPLAGNNRSEAKRSAVGDREAAFFGAVLFHMAIGLCKGMT